MLLTGLRIAVTLGSGHRRGRDEGRTGGHGQGFAGLVQFVVDVPQLLPDVIGKEGLFCLSGGLVQLSLRTDGVVIEDWSSCH